METSNLQDAEFKTLAIEMHEELKDNIKSIKIKYSQKRRIQ